MVVWIGWLFGGCVGLGVGELMTIGLVPEELAAGATAGWFLESSPAMKSNLRPGSGVGFLVSPKAWPTVCQGLVPVF